MRIVNCSSMVVSFSLTALFFHKTMGCCLMQFTILYIMFNTIELLHRATSLVCLTGSTNSTTHHYSHKTLAKVHGLKTMYFSSSRKVLCMVRIYQHPYEYLCVAVLHSQYKHNASNNTSSAVPGICMNSIHPRNELRVH